MRPHGYWNTPEGHKEIQRVTANYKTRGEFRKKENAVYLAAHNQGLLDAVCAHMTGRKPRGYWDSAAGRQEIEESARQCSQRREFETRFSGAYNNALKQGVIDEVCAHMESPKRQHGYWSSQDGMEELVESARRCSTYREFRERFPAAYYAALKTGAKDEICKHLEYDKAYPPNFWNTEEGREEMERCVAQCETRDEFRKRFSRAYNTAKKMGVLDDVCQGLGRIRQVKGYWETDEGIAEIARVALGFAGRARFKEAHPELYLAVRRSGNLEKICAHMEYGGVGFDSTAPAIMYLLDVLAPDGSNLSKLGITGIGTAQRYIAEKATYTVVAEWEFELGANARDAETTIKRQLSQHRYSGSDKVLTSGGDTELFTLPADQLLLLMEDLAMDYGGVGILKCFVQ